MGGQEARLPGHGDSAPCHSRKVCSLLGATGAALGLLGGRGPGTSVTGLGPPSRRFIGEPFGGRADLAAAPEHKAPRASACERPGISCLLARPLKPICWPCRRKVEVLLGPGSLIKQFPGTPPTAAPPSKGGLSQPRLNPKPGDPSKLRPLPAGLGLCLKPGRHRPDLPGCWPRGHHQPWGTGPRRNPCPGPWAARSLARLPHPSPHHVAQHLPAGPEALGGAGLGLSLFRQRAPP